MSDDLEKLRERSPDVISYRLSVLENEVNQIDRKLDSFISLYPSKELLDIMLEPIKSTVEGLRLAITSLGTKLEEADQRKANERSQLKMVVVAAIISPIISLIISLIVGIQLSKGG